MNIIWSDKLKTGIPAIDEQHQFIVEALSGVQVSKLKGAKLFELLINLQAYLSTHFDLEESYMKDTNYPEYAIHKANHDEVLQDTKNILTQNNGNHSPSEVALQFVKYMQRWFFEHYHNTDVKMTEYLKQNIDKINKS